MNLIAHKPSLPLSIDAWTEIYSLLVTETGHKNFVNILEEKEVWHVDII